MSKDILYAFQHYGVTPDSVKAAEKVLADNGIEADEVQTVLQAIGYALLDCELYPCPECLKRGGIVKRDPGERVFYAGRFVTYEQKEEISYLANVFWEWFDTNSEASGLEEKYEKETGKSCVWWVEDEGACVCTLPRTEDYASNGFTDEFVGWVNGKVVDAYMNGAKTVQAVKSALIWK